MKLMGRMMSFILSPAVIGLMLLSAVGYWMAGGMVREQIRGDAAAILDAEAVGMEAVFRGLSEAMIPFTKNNRLRTLAESWDKLGTDAKRNGVRGSLDMQIVKAGCDSLRGFVDDSKMAYLAMLISADGKVLAYRLDGQGDGLHKTIGEDYSSRPYFKACVESGKPVQRTIVSKSTGAISTMMAVPLIENGRTIAVIAVGIRNAAVSDMTMKRIKVGEKGHSYAYGHDGRVVLHRQADRIGKDVSSTPLFAAMKGTPNGRMEIKDEAGNSKIVYWKSLPTEGCYLALELDSAEVLGPTHNFLRNMMLMGAGFGLVVGCIIFFMARGIARLVGGFSRITDAVAGGRLEESPEERTLLDKASSRKDEFNVMGRGMRTMMSSLAKLISESEEKTRAAEEATVKAEKATHEAEEAARRAEAAKSEGMHAAAEQLEGMVGAISAAASELSAQIEQSDRGAVESSQRLGEAATAMNEMNATVQE
ncbi:MAG: methyl-accepting chemotaxis protein, partial [Desulfovibrio sp.]|nr:methyl-accepting chemotaxis protein [Desulfovibrio sp.]